MTGAATSVRIAPHGTKLIRQMHLHLDTIYVLRQIADHIAGLGRVAVDINSKDGIARIVHADCRA